MKRLIILLSFSFLLSACKKESPSQVIAFDLFCEPATKPIEWDHISGEYSKPAGKLIIHAESLSGEAFKLQMLNIADTGLINDFTLNQLFFTDGNDFIPVLIKEKELIIHQLNPALVEGSLQAVLSDEYHDKKIYGKFRINLSVN